MSFSAESYGKAILVGEHAVLRGSAALVLPVKNYSTHFSYRDDNEPFRIRYQGECSNEVELVFPRLYKHGWICLQKRKPLGERQAEKSLSSLLNGELLITSNLPLGTGLGASAALCVGLAQFFSYKNWLLPDEIYGFATELEGLFHGESSGVDTAVALEGKSLKFKRGGERAPLVMKWKPKFYLSYSGQKGLTEDCVDKVKARLTNHPEMGAATDKKMSLAVEKAEAALVSANQDIGFSILSEAMSLACECFYEWDLCPDLVKTEILRLRMAGAAGVKPTGSGGGGYLLSLWLNDPPRDLNLTEI